GRLPIAIAISEDEARAAADPDPNPRTGREPDRETGGPELERIGDRGAHEAGQVEIERDRLRERDRPREPRRKPVRVAREKLRHGRVRKIRLHPEERERVADFGDDLHLPELDRIAEQEIEVVLLTAERVRVVSGRR